MYNLMQHKLWYFVFSAMIIIPGTFSLITRGLSLSIDFTGGSLMEVSLQNSPTQTDLDEKIKAPFDKEKVTVTSVNRTGDNTFLIRSKPIDNETHKRVLTLIEQQFGTTEEKRFESVGPTVGNELTRKAIISVIMATFAIVVYISYSFRKIPKPYSSWRFGMSAVIALLHDVLVVVGIFSILGNWSVEIDALFVTALLTIIGFSVHDTIVVFDRIRENLSKMERASFESVVNESVIQTFVRSLNTSVTVLLALLAILLFGNRQESFDIIRIFTILAPVACVNRVGYAYKVADCLVYGSAFW